MPWLAVKISIHHRFQTHWTGGYSKADFDRLIAPLMSEYNAAIDRKHSAVSKYHINFKSYKDAAEFRTELTRRVKLLHSKASYDWEVNSMY